MARAHRASRGAGSLSGLSITQIHSELRRRERRVGTLVRRRERLAAKLAKLDQHIASLGGRIRGGAVVGVRRRPKNDSNLVEALKKLLSNKTMSVTEASEAVQKAGYNTTAANFRTIVNQTLINSGEFKRVSRGQYTSK